MNDDQVQYNGQTPILQTESVPCEFCDTGYHIGTAFTKSDARWNARHSRGACRAKAELSDDVLQQIARGVMSTNPEHWVGNTLSRLEATSAALHADGRLR
jgi:hypothetical protein